MIIARITSGLGNQLFQYAFARRLAFENECLLKLDISEYRNPAQARAYQLSHFSIVENIASDEEIARFVREDKRSLLDRIRRKEPIARNGRRVSERQFQFDPDVINTDCDVYLEGYWQSEKYFKPIEATIRREFQLKPESLSQNAALIDRMNSVSSVSIHIRRGDYVSNPVIAKTHGTLPLDYYENAISRISEYVPDPHFFVFSDDTEWAKQNFTTRFSYTVVENEPSRACEDLHLMTLCKHHIIANSSFSWWGAWLNSSVKKVVIAPAKWFIGERLDTRDLVPVGWIRV